MVLQSLFATIFQFKIRFCLFEENYEPNQYLTEASKRLYMHMTGVNYGIDGKKITDKLCTSIIYVK